MSDKKLLNEVLPDPQQAERDLRTGSPRDRTRAHLKRIVAAAAALQLGTAWADNTIPGGDKPKNDKGKQTKKEPRPPDPPSYGVVDPMPPPYINRNEGEAFLTIESTPPGAHVLIDGANVGQTPVTKSRVSPGTHAITVTNDFTNNKNVTVDVKRDKTVKQSFDLRAPSPPPKSKK
jgi:hypothetical protein